MAVSGPGEAGAPEVSAVVATVGASSWLLPCLEALRREGEAMGPGGLEILLVDQADRPCELPEGLVDRRLRPGRNLGFAVANNLALARARGELLALVNDDAIVEEGWLARLAEALRAAPEAAAAQGVNLRLEEPSLADGCGLAWSRRWQARQIGHGQPAPGVEEPIRPVFGVSATAALFRRRALETVSGQDLQVFEPALGSYYEDVDLACRLRRRSHEALLVPAARARHAGSTTGEALRGGSTPWVYGNRLLVLARHLGRGFWPRLPLFLLRDALDLAHALGRGELRRAAGIPRGWARALGLLPRFAHLGPGAGRSR